MVEAIKHFQERAEKAIALEDVLKNTEFPQKIDFSYLPSLEARAKLYIKIARARYEAGDVSEHELAFHRCYAIEVQIHEARWSNGQYEDILGPISEKMRAVEKSYGLSDDEYCPISEASDEYKSLSKEYDLVLEQKLLEAFSEFGADDLRDLYINDPEEFYKFHDAGRVAIFQKDEHAKLKSIAIYYENEARACEDAGSFLAAAVMLGSAIESRLILTCLENEAHIDKLDTVGQPGEGCDIRIIDDKGRELPQGEAGEVVGHCDRMMDGYHRRPEATAEASWYDEQGRRFQKSGDIGWFDKDNFLHLLDRKKDVIISGGFNIYAIDLERVLLSHGDVLDAAVIAAPSEQWGETPLAFVVVAATAGALDAEGLRVWANSQLGKAQRISEIRLIDELPRSPIGKVLKRELRAGLGAP